MRTSSIYGVSVPELGDRADITVVSDAIMSNEDNQSGKVENMKATLNSTIIELKSECRTNKLLKYYNGLSIQFVSPVDINAGNSYNIKIDNLAEQPYNNKIDIKLGDVVVAIYGESGFVSYGTALPRSSSVESDSEVSIATSKSVKIAYDKGVEALDKANTKLDAGDVTENYNTAEKIENIIKEIQENKADKTVKILAGNGLQGGGDISESRTINIVSGIAGLVVNADNISLSLKDTYEDTSTTHAPTANALKKLYDFVKASIACPYKVGDIFLTTNATNPSTVWLGTTWQKIEGRMLLGTSGSGASKATGGSNTVKLSTANLPSHTHSASQSAHTHSRGTMEITGAVKTTTDFGIVRGPGSCTGAFAKTGRYGNRPEGVGGTGSTDFDFAASRAWSGATSSAQPAVTVGATGSGSAFSILSSYYTVHMWLRLT